MINNNLKETLMKFGDGFTTFVAMIATTPNALSKAELLLTSAVSAIIEGWPVNIINKEYGLEIMDDSRKGDGVYMFNHYVYPKAAEIYTELWKECCSYIKDTWICETFEKKCGLCITDLMELLLNFLVPYIYKRTNIRSSGQFADRMFSNSEMYKCFISMMDTILATSIIEQYSLNEEPLKSEVASGKGVNVLNIATHINNPYQPDNCIVYEFLNVMSIMLYGFCDVVKIAKVAEVWIGDRNGLEVMHGLWGVVCSWLKELIPPLYGRITACFKMDIKDLVYSLLLYTNTPSIIEQIPEPYNTFEYYAANETHAMFDAFRDNDDKIEKIKLTVSD